jgi:hypothetical protein
MVGLFILAYDISEEMKYLLEIFSSPGAFALLGSRQTKTCLSL